MKRALLLSLFVLSPLTLPAQEFQAKVLSVQSADSFTASVYGRPWRVRLADVVAPSAKAGAASLRSMIGGKSVTIKVQGTDADGRIIARVNAGGTDVSNAMLGAGAVTSGNPGAVPSYAAEKAAAAKPASKRAAVVAKAGEKKTSGSGNIDEEEIRQYLMRTPEFVTTKK
jgi:endonuclease YncB( thermonuclease family)